ncbi:MAG: hypothetical protein AAF797_02270 [Planctomycetota bacterium]
MPSKLPADTPPFTYLSCVDPPTLHVVPLDPPIMQGAGVYGGWGQGAIGPHGRFHFAVGNHLTSPRADAWLITYDPDIQTLRRAMSSRDTDRWHDRQSLGDGKLHTGIDIAEDGTTYLLTFYGDYPTKRDWQGSQYPGGRLIRHNVLTGESESLGVPFGKDSWPMGRWDPQREVLVGVGEAGLYLNPELGRDQAPEGWRWSGPDNEHSYGHVLVYDTRSRQVLYAGLPEDLQPQASAETPLRVERRSLLLDPNTGHFFSSGTASPTRLVKIDPAAIRRNPAEGIRRTNLEIDSPVRAGTRRTTPDGELILITRHGTLYALHAENLTLRELGPAWVKDSWITDLSLDPTGRYVDFVVDCTWAGRDYGVPVVRYELATGRRFVFAFLAPALFASHGYCVVGAYTAVTNPTGQRMFIQLNGHFGDDPAVARYEQPVLIDLPIPTMP